MARAMSKSVVARSLPTIFSIGSGSGAEDTESAEDAADAEDAECSEAGSLPATLGAGSCGRSPFPDTDRADRPLAEQIHPIGVIAQIQAMQRGNGTLLIEQGVMRAEVQAVVQTEPYLRCVVQPRPDPETWDEETEQLALEVRGLVEAFIELTPGLPEGVINYVRSIRAPGHLADNSAYAPEYTYEQRLQLLDRRECCCRCQPVHLPDLQPG